MSLKSIMATTHPTLKCANCNESFDTKQQLKKHMKECVKPEVIPQQIIPTTPQQTVDNVDNVGTIANIFIACLNILRTDEGMAGDDALKNFTNLFILKLIEPHFGKTIDIDTYKYDFSHVDGAELEIYKQTVFKLVRFTNLSQEIVANFEKSDGKDKLNNIFNSMKHVWEDVLAVHPATKNIFMAGTFFVMQSVTFAKLIQKLQLIDMTKTQYDILGNSYEQMICNTMTGKTLGQFFTPPSIKNIMIKLIDPKILPNGRPESMCDRYLKLDKT